MTVVSNTVELCRNRLLAATRETVNQVSGSLSAGAPTVTFKNAVGGIQQGAVINIGYELLYVLSSSNASAVHTATVIRGWAGSTAATAADGDVVLVNPKWSRYAVLNEINNELDGLSAEGLYKVASVDVTYNPVIEGYDLGVTDGQIDEVLQVRFQTPGPAKDWPLVDPSSYSLQRIALTADFPDNVALQLRRGGFSGFDVRVVYKSPFTRAADSTKDLTSDCGLPGTCVDIVEIGAAIRMTYAREVARNANFTQQTGTTKAQDEPAAALVNAAKGWETLYQNRVNREVDRLERRWPHERSFF